MHPYFFIVTENLCKPVLQMQQSLVADLNRNLMFVPTLPLSLSCFDSQRFKIRIPRKSPEGTFFLVFTLKLRSE